MFGKFKRIFLPLSVLVVFIAAIVFISGCMSPMPKARPNENLILPKSLVTPWGTLPVNEVSGNDLPCIGHYDNMIRVAYDKSTDSDGSYDIHIVYYKQGDMFGGAKSYFVSQLKKCGYALSSENQGSFSAPGFQMLKEYDADYSKNNADLSLTIAVLKIGGNEYSFVDIEYNYYNESSPEEGSSNSENNTGNEASNSASSEDDYTSQVEVQPNGQLAQEFNNIIKPKLILIYGGAKLIKSSTVSYNSMQGTDLTYFVKRPVKASDDSALGDIMRNAGYQVISDKVSDFDINIDSVKEGKPALSLSAILGEQKVEFVGYKIQ